MATTSGMQNNEGFKAFTSSTALAAYRCVELAAAGTVTYPTGATGEILGVTQHACTSGAMVTVKLLTAGGSYKIEGNSTWTLAAGGTVLYVVPATGRVDDADPGAGHKYFRALEANTGGQGSFQECVPYLYHTT